MNKTPKTVNNLQISLTEFRNESRVMRESGSIASLKGIGRVYIAALHAPGLQTDETLAENIVLKRFELSSRKWSKGLLLQIFKYFEFVIRLLWHYRGKNIGVVNIHILGLLPLGYLFKLFYGAYLIYDTHELETETHGLGGTRKKLVKIVERLLIRKSDVVFVVSENIADWYAAEYGIVRPTVVLNAPKLLAGREKSDRLRQALGIRPDQVIFLYQGLLGRGRGVENMIAAFKDRSDDRAVVVFMGYGELTDLITENALASDRVYIHPAVPPDELLDYTSSADVGASLIENTCLSYYFCMPNKLFEYAMVGLPVIVSNLKEMREVVAKYDMGVVAESDRPEAINRAIDELLARDLGDVGSNARVAAEENAWEVQETRMLEQYHRLGLNG